MYLCLMIINNCYKNKAGVYKITNILNNKSYIGGAVDLKRRGSDYIYKYNQKTVHNLHLQASMNKYGIENFKFEVLEEIDFDSIINTTEKWKLISKREQYYYNFYKPEYNKKEKVDSSLGLKVSEKTKEKISKSLKKAFLEGRKKILKIQKHSIAVSLFNSNGEFIKDFNTLVECANYVEVHSESVGSAIKSRRKVLKSFICLKTTEKHLINNFLNLKRGYCRRKLTVLDLNTNIISDYTSCIEFTKLTRIKNSTVLKYYNSGAIIHNKYKILYYGK